LSRRTPPDVSEETREGKGLVETATQELHVKTEEHATRVDTQEISSIVVRAMALTMQL